MKTKKRNRLLSAFLAILMVFAVCPTIALSAQEPTAQSADPITYWDGTVPGLNGTTYAVVDNVLAGTTMPAYVVAGTAYYLSKAQFDAHFTLGAPASDNGRAQSITIKDEVGFAMFCLMTNNSFYIIDTDNGNSVWFNGARSTSSTKIDGIHYLWHQDAFITFADDFYMNDPAKDRTEWHSLVPLFWRKPTATKGDPYRTRIEGNNHAIVGWYIKYTSTQAGSTTSLNGYGLVGTWHGNYYGNLIQNVAMLDAAMDLTIPSTTTSVLCAGGIVGNIIGDRAFVPSGWEYNSASNTFTIQNCIADIEINLNNARTDSGYWWNGSGAGDKPLNTMIGGLIGTPSIIDMQGVNPWKSYTSSVTTLTMTNNLVNLCGTATGTPCALVGGLTSRITTGMKTLTIKDNYVLTDLKGYDTEYSLTKVAYMDATATTLTANGNWFYAKKNNSAQNTALPSTMSTASNNKTMSATNVLDSAYFDTNKGTGFASWTSAIDQIPTPTALASNALVVAKAKEMFLDLSLDSLKTTLAAGEFVEIATAKELCNAFTAANRVRAEDNDASYGDFHFRLTANIDMTGYELPVVTNIKSFDGQGYVISNLTLNRTANATDTYIGGLCDYLGNSDASNVYAGTFRNVAFVNYTLHVDAAACTGEYFVGGLFGYVGTNSEISNVYVQGDLKVNGTTVGDNGGRLGTFGAALRYNNGSLGATFENCIFVGTASAPKAVAPFMEVLGYSNDTAGDNAWAAIAQPSATYTDKLEIVKPERQIKMNNCYSLCYTANAEGKFDTWSPTVGDNIGMQALALTNVYQVGLTQNHELHHENSAKGYENVVDANGNSLWYLDRVNAGDIANGNPIAAASGATYDLIDFQGAQEKNAMIFNNPAEWTWFDYGTPIPTVFGENASVLSVKSINALLLGLSQPTFLGAQLRLDKAGMRFVAEFDVEKHLEVADGKTVEFGFLVLPTVAITNYGQKLTYDNANVLKISTTNVNQLLAEGDPRLGGIPVQKEGGKILLGVMTSIPDAVLQSLTEFTVAPFVAYLDHENKVVNCFAEDTTVQKFSGVYCASALCASETVADDVKQMICQAFAGANGFLYFWNESTETCELLDWELNAATQIVYKAPIAFSTENRTAYNAYYMEKNVVTVFQEELNKAMSTSVPIVDRSSFDDTGAMIIEAKVVSDGTLGESEYRISMVGTANYTVLVEAGHYAALETALDVLKADLIQNNGIMPNSYSKNAATSVKISGISSAFSTYGAAVNNYKLVWSDEFNASSLDYDRWCYDKSNPIKNVSDVNVSNKATVTDGNLNINTYMKNSVYYETSLVTTFGTMNWNGGYMEMRGSIPYDVIGKWVSMWATTDNSSIFIKEWKAENGISGNGTWGIKPTDAPSAANNYASQGMGLEVDILETWTHYTGGQTGIHLYPAETSREQNQDEYDFGSSWGGYHTYGFFWNRDYMVFTVDGSVHYTFHLKNRSGGESYIDTGYYSYGDFDPGKIALSLILQNDVFTYGWHAAGQWAPVWTQSGWYDHTFKIDYIRLYQTEGDMLYLPHEGVTKGVDANGNFNWTF